MNKGAEFSTCGTYRYSLWRIWDESKALVMFIGLNPSTANQHDNDPTINRVVSFANAWGYGGVYMTNLFTVISSDPKVLKERNTSWIDFLADRQFLSITARKCEAVVFAWGNFKEAQARASEVARDFPNALCLKKNKNGSPIHPLYVHSSTKPIKYKS